MGPEERAARKFCYAVYRETVAEQERLRHVQEVLKEYERRGEEPQYSGAGPITPTLLAAVKGPPRTAPPAVAPRPAAKPKPPPEPSDLDAALKRFGELIRK